MAALEASASARENDNGFCAKPAWAGREMRLDPYQLPQRVEYNHEGHNAVNVTLGSNGAVMKRQLNCGLPLSMSLPSRAFEGVAARAFENEDGSTTVTLELRHSDKDLSVPLCVSDAVEDVACDWHSWARALNLPMLMIDEAGNANVVKVSGLAVDAEPAPRRRRVSSIRHRPNFLRRRKSGTVGPIERLHAREIIARN